MNYRNWFSKERITNNDDFRFKSPITRPDHFRLVLTPLEVFIRSKNGIQHSNRVVRAGFWEKNGDYGICTLSESTAEIEFNTMFIPAAYHRR